MTITLGVDVSHYQGNPNFAQVKASGNLFVCQKATESTNYVDPTYATNRRNAHGAGLVFGSYHFSRYGNVNAEADWFTSHAQVINGEFVMLDWEISAPDPVGWSLAWLKRVEANLGVKPFIYLNSAAMNGYNWGPVADSGYPLWLAKYDFVTTPPTTKWWPIESSLPTIESTTCRLSWIIRTTWSFRSLARLGSLSMLVPTSSVIRTRATSLTRYST
jgi:GH25 family lysozyme M1 (1,4-beta-N-acetylmuramidase)